MTNEKRGHKANQNLKDKFKNNNSRDAQEEKKLRNQNVTGGGSEKVDENSESRKESAKQKKKETQKAASAGAGELACVLPYMSGMGPMGASAGSMSRYFSSSEGSRPCRWMSGLVWNTPRLLSWLRLL